MEKQREDEACQKNVGTIRTGVFVEEQYGARVATIRDGNNAVEMKDNRDGTCDLTVFWYDEERGRQDDMTAYKMKRADLMAMRRAIDAMLLGQQVGQTIDA